MGDRGSGRENFPSLTGARGVCLAFVFLNHMVTIFPHKQIVPGVDWISTFIEAPGGIAVPFFFVLSGFLLTWHWRADRPLSRYARIRVARIFPMHVVTWAIMVGAAIAFHRGLGPLPIVFANLFLLQAWVLDSAWQLSLNGPTWSLSNEIFMYALMPLFIVGANVRVRRVVLTGVASLAVMSVPLFGLSPPENVLVWPPANLFAFVVGMLAAHLLRTPANMEARQRWLTRATVVVSSVAVACVVVIAAVGGLRGAGIPAVICFWASAMVLAGILVIRLVGRDREGRGGRLLLTPVMQQLGIYSFPAYITHIVVLINLLYALGGNPRTYGGALFTVVCTAAGTFVASVLIHKLVDVPAYRLLTRQRRPSPVDRSGASAPRDNTAPETDAGVASPSN